MPAPVRLESWKQLSAYQFREVGRVEEFLRENGDLTALLEKAAPAIRRVFGRAAKLSLEMVSNPGECAGSPELFVLIGVACPPAEARERLLALDRTWWRAASRAAAGRLNLDIEND